MNAALLLAAALAAAPDAGPPPDAAAQAAFAALERPHAEFLRAKLEAPPGQPPDVDAATLKLKRLQSRYEQVVQLGAPRWSVASWVRIGELIWHLAEMLDAVPVPLEVKKLGPDEERTYLNALRQRQNTIRDQAVEFWKRAAALATRFKVQSPELEAVRARWKAYVER